MYDTLSYPSPFKMADEVGESSHNNYVEEEKEHPQYQGIMAFDTAETLLNLSDEDYIPPKFPFELPSFDSSVSFGKELRKHFLLDLDNWTFINHGAFGCVLKEALEAAYKWQCYVERQPVRFLDRELLSLLGHVNRRLANFVGSDPTNIVLLPNVTTAINTVLKSMAWRAGDIVYFFNTCYYTVKKLLKYLNEEFGKRTWSITCVINPSRIFRRNYKKELVNRKMEASDLQAFGVVL